LGLHFAPGATTFTLFKSGDGRKRHDDHGGQTVWNNNLAVDGTISVATLIATTPGPLNNSLSGNSLRA